MSESLKAHSGTPLPQISPIMAKNVTALLVFLNERKARDYHFVAVEDVERLLATGRTR